MSCSPGHRRRPRPRRSQRTRRWPSHHAPSAADQRGLKSKANQMTAKRANGCSNDNYLKEFDMKTPSWRCTCWRAGVGRVRLGGRPAGVDVGLPGGVFSPCVNNGRHQHLVKWLQDKKSSSARGEKLTFEVHWLGGWSIRLRSIARLLRRGLSFGRAHTHTADPKVTPAPPSALYLRPYCI